MLQKVDDTGLMAPLSATESTHGVLLPVHVDSVLINNRAAAQDELHPCVLLPAGCSQGETATSAGQTHQRMARRSGSDGSTGQGKRSTFRMFP